MVFIGTSDEICEEFNISIRTFNWFRSKSYKKILENRKKTKRARVIVRVDDDLEESDIEDVFDSK